MPISGAVQKGLPKSLTYERELPKITAVNIFFYCKCGQLLEVTNLPSDNSCYCPECGNMYEFNYSLKETEL